VSEKEEKPKSLDEPLTREELKELITEAILAAWVRMGGKLDDA
jgi:hypothetical protein